jgi:muramoyltetrapeptide carboxypeptidase LdcA involved in peptidoglycan recycling
MDLFDPGCPPIVGGFDIGHGLADNLTLPVGLVATLDSEKGTLAYHSAATVG